MKYISKKFTCKDSHYDLTAGDSGYIFEPSNYELIK
jgi:hypothetical protein